MRAGIIGLLLLATVAKCNSRDEGHTNDLEKKALNTNRELIDKRTLLSERDSYDEWHAWDFDKKDVASAKINEKKSASDEKVLAVKDLSGSDLATYKKEIGATDDKRAYGHAQRRPPSKKNADKRAYGNPRRPPSKKDSHAELVRRAYGHGQRRPTKRDLQTIALYKKAYGHQRRPPAKKSSGTRAEKSEPEARAVLGPSERSMDLERELKDLARHSSGKRTSDPSAWGGADYGPPAAADYPYHYGPPASADHPDSSHYGPPAWKRTVQTVDNVKRTSAPSEAVKRTSDTSGATKRAPHGKRSSGNAKTMRDDDRAERYWYDTRDADINTRY